MSSYRKASIRELATAAYELESGVIEGQLQRDAENEAWTIDDTELNEWLSEYKGQKIVLIVASLEDERPMPKKLCRTCGTEYRGIECPRCREARIRLRGR